MPNSFDDFIIALEAGKDGHHDVDTVHTLSMDTLLSPDSSLHWLEIGFLSGLINDIFVSQQDLCKLLSSKVLHARRTLQCWLLVSKAPSTFVLVE